MKCATNGKEALKELGCGFRPDLTLLDLMMPVMNGLEFLTTLRNIETSTHGHNKVILLTASYESKFLEAAKALSDGYLSKPARPEELKELVTQKI